jgi:hypothetical protein
MNTITTTSRASGRNTAAGDTFAERVATADWDAVTGEVDEYGCALLPQLLTPGECTDLTGLYDQPKLFRSTVNMRRHRFGEGEYRYFDHPLPEAVQRLREELYPRLLPIARDWYGKLCWSNSALGRSLAERRSSFLRATA